jgi:hypothetical protein
MTTKRPMLDRILHVFGASAVIQVLHSVVVPAAVSMTNMSALWTGADKGNGDERGYLGSLNVTEPLQDKPPVSIPVSSYRQKSSGEHATVRITVSGDLINLTVKGANLTIRTNLVQTFKPDNGQPSRRNQ